MPSTGLCQARCQVRWGQVILASQKNGVNKRVWGGEGVGEGSTAMWGLAALVVYDSRI